MALLSGPDVITHYQRLKTARSPHESRWEAMAPYIAPSRVGIVAPQSPGQSQTRNVYDSTMMMAAELLSMFMAGHIINPSQQWFSYRMRDPRMDALDPVKEWMEECRDRTLRRLSSSMFYAEGPESLIDYVGFGTGFLLAEEMPQPENRVIQGFRGFFFQAQKTGRFVIEDGADGLVDTAMREFTMSARVAQSQWPVLPEPITKAIATGKADTAFTFIHAILPRAHPDHRKGALGMPWASVWVEKESKFVVHEGGYHAFPAAIPRYHRTPGEVYGRGRGDLAFDDVLTLNTAKRMGLEDWALKIRPPVMMRHDSVIGSLRLEPGGAMMVNAHGQRIQDVLAPWETGSRPEVSHLNEENLRRSIREIFFVDTVQKLLEINKSEMTAFEYAKKLELLFRLLGPVYGRLEWEYLHRVIDVLFTLQFAAGDFSPPPPEVFDGDGNVDIEFQNPIAKAQRAGEAEALTMAFNDLAPLGQIFPNVWDRFDPDKLAAGILNIRGFPAAWTRTDDEMAELRSARDAKNQQELAMQQAQGTAAAMKDAAPMVKALQPQPTRTA